MNGVVGRVLDLLCVLRSVGLVWWFGFAPSVMFTVHCSLFVVRYYGIMVLLLPPSSSSSSSPIIVHYLIIATSLWSLPHPPHTFTPITYVRAHHTPILTLTNLPKVHTRTKKILLGFFLSFQYIWFLQFSSSHSSHFYRAFNLNLFHFYIYILLHGTIPKVEISTAHNMYH